MKTLNRIAILWGILLIIVFGVLTFFGLQWKAKTSGYFALETKIVDATKSYYTKDHSYPEEGNSVYITLDNLKEDNIIDDLSYNDDECDGFVIVKHDKVITYTGYIKCHNYKSKDYDKLANN